VLENMVGDLLTVDRQKIWTEQINKEAYTRAYWGRKHEELVKWHEENNFQRPRPNTAELEDKIRKLRGPVIPAEIKQTRKKFETFMPKVDQEELSKRFEEFKMKPATPSTRKMIFNGLSHFDEGRKKYLMNRAKTKPEIKWVYPQTSSQDYGWRLTTQITYRTPKYGRGRTIQDTFYRPNGIPITRGKTLYGIC